jgi:hypothetical protein
MSICGIFSVLRSEVKLVESLMGLEEGELFEFELLPVLDFVFGVGHMPERFPGIFLMPVAEPLDKEVSFPVDHFFIDN